LSPDSTVHRFETEFFQPGRSAERVGRFFGVHYLIETGKVTDRRTLRFASIDELLADIDRIVEADKAGKLRRTGNWTAGQAFGHLAAWLNYAYEGYPINPPWFIRLLIRTRKKKYLHDGMAAGVRIPGSKDGTFATEALTTDEGAARLRQALARLKSGEPPKFDSPAFGKMPCDERVAINLRHAQLHFSFLHP